MCTSLWRVAWRWTLNPTRSLARSLLHCDDHELLALVDDYWCTAGCSSCCVSTLNDDGDNSCTSSKNATVARSDLTLAQRERERERERVCVCVSDVTCVCSACGTREMTLRRHTEPLQSAVATYLGYIVLLRRLTGRLHYQPLCPHFLAAAAAAAAARCSLTN